MCAALSNLSISYSCGTRCPTLILAPLSIASYIILFFPLFSVFTSLSSAHFLAHIRNFSKKRTFSSGGSGVDKITILSRQFSVIARQKYRLFLVFARGVFIIFDRKYFFQCYTKNKQKIFFVYLKNVRVFSFWI